MAANTNAELIRGISVSVARIEERMIRIDDTSEELKKIIKGNGKPGLVDRVGCIEAVHAADEKKVEIEQKKLEEKKLIKEKWSGRTWAIIMVFVTQFAGLVVLFIRTGGLK